MSAPNTTTSTTRDLSSAEDDPLVEAPWQESLRRAYRNPLEVLHVLGLDEYANEIDHAPGFPFLVPAEFVKKMRPGDFNDPLLRQVLPLDIETREVSGFVPDPTEESQFHIQAGLLQKYAHRALIITTGGCAINCRYCFRRNYPYQQAVGRERLNAIVRALKEDSQITEVILSGGDPLSLTNRQLGDLIARLDAIGHLKRLRIHTRLPLTIPQRLDTDLQRILRDSRLDVAVVLHANHANEIDDAVSTRLQKLHRSGIVLLNQSVLLRDVNDCAGALIALSERLFSANVLPYYLHLLDRVSGAAHFNVSLARAHALESELTRCLPGYLVPKFVREVPGGQAKTAIHRL